MVGYCNLEIKLCVRVWTDSTTFMAENFLELLIYGPHTKNTNQHTTLLIQKHIALHKMLA